MQKIILASQSPRRKELMESLGIDFEIHVSEFEEIAPANTPAKLLVEYFAEEKAKDVAKHYKDQDALIIGADTDVEFERKVLSKPRSPEEAILMLKRMSGKSCMAYTSITVVDSRTGIFNSATAQGEIFFRALDEEEIRQYVATGDPLDKAGGFAIQTMSGVFIKEIRGDYGAIIGLSLIKLDELLKKFGYSILENQEK